MADDKKVSISFLIFFQTFFERLHRVILIRERKLMLRKCGQSRHTGNMTLKKNEIWRGRSVFFFLLRISCLYSHFSHTDDAFKWNFFPQFMCHQNRQTNWRQSFQSCRIHILARKICKITTTISYYGVISYPFDGVVCSPKCCHAISTRQQ